MHILFKVLLTVDVETIWRLLILNVVLICPVGLISCKLCFNMVATFPLLSKYWTRSIPSLSLRNWRFFVVVYFLLCFVFRKVRETTARKQNLGRKRKRWGRGEGRGRCRFLFRPRFSIRAAVTQLLLYDPRKKNTPKKPPATRANISASSTLCDDIST